MTETPQDDDYILMNAYVRKRPDLVAVFDAMISAFNKAREGGKRCSLTTLQPLYDALVHPILGIWGVAAMKAHILTRTDGPVFLLLERVLNHPKAAVRQRLAHCLHHNSVHARAMAIVDKMANDSAVNTRLAAYWLGLRIAKQELLPRVERYLAAEKNKKGIDALNEIRQFVRDGYLLEPGKHGSTTVYAFCPWGYCAQQFTREEFESTSIVDIVESMRTAKP